MDTTANWTFSHSFIPQFQAMRSDLESRVDAAKALDLPPQELIPELSALLVKMTKSLADATGSIPSYDQKQFEIQLKSLEQAIESLRASNIPKTKFAFKRKPQSPSQVSRPVSTTITKESSVSSHPASSITSSNLSLSLQTNAYLTISSLPTHPQQSDLTLSDLNSCIVNLLPPSSSEGYSLKISALHARNLTRCVVLLPSIDGSGLLENISGCIIILGCHQFRMHSSTRVDVFLSVSSNPIIETCSQIRFSQYPNNFMIPNPERLAPFSVQDFSHIRSTRSPNFLMMSDDDRDSIVHWLATSRENPSHLSDLSTILPT